VVGSYEFGDELLGFIRGKEFLDQLTDCHPLNKNSMEQSPP